MIGRVRDALSLMERKNKDSRVGRTIDRGIQTPKRGNRLNYKGYGAPTMGKHTSKGRFKIMVSRIPEIVVPDLSDCDLKPYVANNTPKVKVAPPTVPEINLDEIEVDILDIVAPQHKKLRQQKKELNEKVSAHLDTKNGNVEETVEEIQA
eukprot:TRINITY_DN3006_c0_g1_i1.p1 TRINITY_DN3006_c0_g1~~TRINITY_DN3006_c0_g1_i1.p1  ORF type:complete len:150 (-),score=49.35 TRINITY_DN3006_c0_g1_i1:20-469(-)